MATPLQPATPAGTPPPRRDMDRFDNRMRFEWADPEQRVLLYSWGFAFLIAILWLITVALYKITPKPFFPDDSVEIELAPTPAVTQPAETKSASAGETDVTKAPAPKDKPPGSRDREKGNPKPKPSGAPKETNSAGAIGSAFGTGSNRGSGGITGDVSSMLRNVAVASGSGGSGAGAGGAGGGGTGGKVVLGGQGGEGGTRPGIGGFGGGTGTGGGGGIGTGVGGGGGIGRSTVRVSGPASVRAPDVVGNRRDVGELGVFVRSRESQLRYCYQEFGLKANPSLAGTVTVAISLTGSGDVTGVNIANRTWSGPGASESESCIRNKIRQWRFPTSAEGGGTYTFPFNFTK